jgi:hypothetical protein
VGYLTFKHLGLSLDQRRQVKVVLKDSLVVSEIEAAVKQIFGENVDGKATSAHATYASYYDQNTDWTGHDYYEDYYGDGYDHAAEGQHDDENYMGYEVINDVLAAFMDFEHENKLIFMSELPD